MRSDYFISRFGLIAALVLVATVSAAQRTPPTRDTPLRQRFLTALSTGDIPAVRSYLAQGIDAHDAVAHAAANCRVALVRYLVQERHLSTERAISFALMCENQEDVEDMLAILIPVGTIERPDYDLAISLAQQHGFGRVLTLLPTARIVAPPPAPLPTAADFWNALQQRRDISPFVTHGIDPNLRNAAGAPALVVAANHNDANAIFVLLAKGADPLARDREGQTALQHAERLSELADSFKTVRGILRFREPDPYPYFEVSSSRIGRLNYAVDDARPFIRETTGRRRYVSSYSSTSSDSAEFQLNLWVDKETPLNIPVEFDLDINIYRADNGLAAHRTERILIPARTRSGPELEQFTLRLPRLEPGSYRLLVQLVDQKSADHLSVSKSNANPSNVLVTRAFAVGSETAANAPSLFRRDDRADLAEFARRIYGSDIQRAIEGILVGDWAGQIAGFPGQVSFVRTPTGMTASIQIDGGRNGTVEESGEVEVQANAHFVIRCTHYRWIRRPRAIIRLTPTGADYTLGTYSGVISNDAFSLDGTVTEQGSRGRTGQWTATRKPQG